MVAESHRRKPASQKKFLWSPWSDIDIIARLIFLRFLSFNMPVISPLFEPLQIRGLNIPNRLVISPMCQYSAGDGLANDWHLVHLGKFAQGVPVLFSQRRLPSRGVGESPTVTWEFGRMPMLKRLRASQGLFEAWAPRLQFSWRTLGAKRRCRAHGNGPLNDEDIARGEEPWKVIAPSAIALGEGWLQPVEMSSGDIARVVEDFAAAARRSNQAGFDIVEVHAAHGYLAASFLSPISNHRKDGYGGDRKGRSRMLLETVEAVRGEWPEEKPLFVRVSAVDGAPEGWSLDDTIALAKDLKELGVDVIDCSSGGILGAATAAKGAPPPLGVPGAIC